MKTNSTKKKIVIKKWYMHAYNKKNINCGKIPPAEIYWFNFYLVSKFFKNKIHLDT